MKSRMELLSENTRLRKEIRRKRTRTVTRKPSEEEIRREARRREGEKEHHENYMSLVRRGLCGRCASRPCVCE